MVALLQSVLQSSSSEGELLKSGRSNDTDYFQDSTKTVVFGPSTTPHWLEKVMDRNAELEGDYLGERDNRVRDYRERDLMTKRDLMREKEILLWRERVFTEKRESERDLIVERERDFTGKRERSYCKESERDLIEKKKREILLKRERRSRGSEARDN